MNLNLLEHLTYAAKGTLDKERFSEDEVRQVKKILQDITKFYSRRAVEGLTPELEEIETQIAAQIANLNDRIKRELKIAISDTLTSFGQSVAQGLLNKALG